VRGQSEGQSAGKRVFRVLGEIRLEWAAGGSIVYYMKMTFDIPAPLAVRFKAAVPRGQRSPLVSRLLALEIKSAESDLAAACEKANSLKLDMKDWENLNESETW
jgi:hypothetical protein